MKRSLRRWLAALLMLVLLTAGGAWGVWHWLQTERTASELIRYALKRLQGHPKLEAVAHPVLFALQRTYERPLASGDLPTLGKGQQPLTLNPSATAHFSVSDANAIALAMRQAQAGQVIEIAPGRYLLKQTLKTGQAGTATAPITLRAALPGSVTLDIATPEGILIQHPYWLIENLRMRGTCRDDGQCEHALHIVGNGHHATIRNNRFEDFNAHIKVNGLRGQWPDHGLIRFNTLSNSRARRTHLPVTPIDIVAASHWQVQDNLISRFVKTSGNQVAFGVFMKGAGSHGRIERNLVVCTPEGISQPGARVGISLGGGGTGKQYCRDGICAAEHFDGIVTHNIVAHCNDFGIDVNAADRSLIAFNTLINTSGIDARRTANDTQISGNLLEGRIRARDGSTITKSFNEVAALPRHFEAPDRLDLRWLRLPETVPSTPALGADFCNKPRRDGTLPGAIDAEQGCPRP